MKGIILFDGVCNLCTSSVQFIIKRDPLGKFKFASIQSQAGEHLINKYNIGNAQDSFIFIDSKKQVAYTKSTAALLVCKHLTGVVKILYPLRVIPHPLRDIVYLFISKNRYKWFGKKNECMLPSPELKTRFLQ